MNAVRTGWLALVMAASAALAGTTSALETSLEGEWIGLLELSDALYEFRFVFERSADGWHGSMDLPFPAPLLDIQVDGNHIRFALLNRAILAGRYDAGRIVGTMEMADIDDTIHLARRGSVQGDRLSEKIAGIRDANRPGALDKVRGGPGRHSVDAAALDRLLAAANAAGTDGMALYHDGALVAEWRAAGGPSRVPVMSVTKPIVGLAVGRLMFEGAIDSLDMPVSEVFPEWDRGWRAEVTLRHLMTHTSGLDHARNTHGIRRADDAVRFALDSDITRRPGREAEYNNNAMSLLAGVVAAIADRPLDEFVAATIFAPLGIDDYAWKRDPQGNAHGGSGLALSAGDLAKIGKLVLDGGVWEGERLLDAHFVAQSVSPQVEPAAIPQTGDIGIGLTWFLTLRDDEVTAFHHSGDLGQYLIVYPRERLVAARVVGISKGYDPANDALPEFRQLSRAVAVASASD